MKTSLYILAASLMFMATNQVSAHVLNSIVLKNIICMTVTDEPAPDDFEFNTKEIFDELKSSERKPLDVKPFVKVEKDIYEELPFSNDIS
jgi:hypothetical protein